MSKHTPPLPPAESMSPLVRDVLAGFEEYAAHTRGEPTVIRTYSFPAIPDQVDVKAIRHKLGMTQQQFTRFGFSLGAIRHWEAHRRTPEGPARVLLMVIDRNPSVVLDTLHG